MTDTPCVAESGVMGLMDSVETGLACGSDTSHLAIFGYDPRLTYRGRGAFESLGAGCSMDPGDIAFKSNLATIDDASNIVKQRRVDRSFEKEGPVLCEFLNGVAPAHSLYLWKSPQPSSIPNLRGL
jgi:2,3-bisphosphoglycerate-independent phosphoglycerate mutase